jgi:hypothetical protein
MKGDGDMTRTWARSRLDMDILGKLYDLHSLRGTTLAVLFTPYDIQKTYDRLYALQKNGRIAAKTYMEKEGIAGRNKINNYKKKGQMYYLTGLGVQAVKEQRGIPVNGDKEQGMKISDKQLKWLYDATIIVENVKLQFEDGRNYIKEHDLRGSLTIDLIYKDWLILIERSQSKPYLKQLCNKLRGLMLWPGFGNVMILCPTETQASKSARVWKDEIGPEVWFMSQTNYKGIKMLLRGIAHEKGINVVSFIKGRVEDLHQPENGYTHKVAGEMCIIKDLIGFSPKAMRQITSSLDEGKKKYIVVEKMTQLPLIVRRFPELLNPAHEFITLDGACETSEGINEVYSRKRNQTRSI